MPTEPAGSRGSALRGTIGAGLLLAGLLCLGLWRVFSGTENLAFTEGASAPPWAHVTEGDDYSLAVPGGVRAMIAHGVFGPDGGQLSLNCEWRTRGSITQALTVDAEHTNTKAETTVARFAAPLTGDIRVTCANWGAVFIADADDVSADTSGWFLLGAVVALTVGVGLAISAARSAALRNSGRPREDEQVERLVDLGSAGRYDGEVAGPDARDVPP